MVIPATAPYSIIRNVHGDLFDRKFVLINHRRGINKTTNLTKFPLPSAVRLYGSVPTHCPVFERALSRRFDEYDACGSNSVYTIIFTCRPP